MLQHQEKTKLSMNHYAVGSAYPIDVQSKLQADGSITLTLVFKPKENTSRHMHETEDSGDHGPGGEHYSVLITSEKPGSLDYGKNSEPSTRTLLKATVVFPDCSDYDPSRPDHLQYTFDTNEQAPV